MIITLTTETSARLAKQPQAHYDSDTQGMMRHMICMFVCVEGGIL